MLQVVEQEMLSAVPQVSRYTQMQLFDLEVKSPRVRAVKRLFLGSLTQHRYHLPSQCPRPPCNHFAPAPSHFPSSSLRQLMFAEDGHKAVILVHRPSHKLPMVLGTGHLVKADDSVAALDGDSVSIVQGHLVRSLSLIHI